MHYDPLQAWPAPAKINLFLHVLAKRDDGYHELQTAFQFLSVGDELFFTLNENSEIRRAYDFGFSEADDLCLRAAHKLKPYAKPEHGVTIDLIKRLPMGGGLGGGSSDAATVLIALNQLWELGLSTSKLAEIGLELGADVPVFVEGRAAWAQGVGELLTPINACEDWYLVLNPNIEVSTAQIFKKVRDFTKTQVFSNKGLTLMPQMKKIRALEKGIGSEALVGLLKADLSGKSECVIDSTFGVNQLEAIVREEYPEVNDLLEWLSQFGQPRMSGSGGSVFLPVGSKQAGLEILARRPSDSAGFVAKGENFHPLFKKIE